MGVMHDAINWDDVATMNEVCAVVELVGRMAPGGDPGRPGQHLW
ncbi:MAG TPA: hypothetical protein VK063_05915 [Beutenbergiaceae bacterium]|nr:hypothetical protein [Beutenbergiaceae bacterium]